MTNQFDIQNPAVAQNLARVNNEIVMIRSVNGGWTTVVDVNGKESKQHMHSVVLLTADEVNALYKKAAPKTNNSQFKKGQSVYTCNCCGRKTRQTGNGDNELVELCEQCYDMAGLFNRVQDGGELTETEKAECRAKCAFIVSKNGTPDDDHVEMCGFKAEEHKTGSTVKPDYKKQLHKERIELANGSKKAAMDCNDETANTLRALTVAEVFVYAANVLAAKTHKKVAHSGSGDAAKVESSLKEMYSHLNPGLQRMNLGNLIRAAQKA